VHVKPPLLDILMTWMEPPALPLTVWVAALPLCTGHSAGRAVRAFGAFFCVCGGEGVKGCGVVCLAAAAGSRFFVSYATGRQQTSALQPLSTSLLSPPALCCFLLTLFVVLMMTASLPWVSQAAFVTKPKKYQADTGQSTSPGWERQGKERSDRERQGEAATRQGEASIRQPERRPQCRGLSDHRFRRFASLPLLLLLPLFLSPPPPPPPPPPVFSRASACSTAVSVPAT